jgi:DNA-binding CsgD family transcriptional regulator
MHLLTNGFIDANLPYLTLLVGVVGCLLLYLGMGQQVFRLRRALVHERRRVDGLEQRFSTTAGQRREAALAEAGSKSPASDTARQKVLELHGLGRSSGEIARQAGIREAEVDFLLRVQQHLAVPGRTLALRKIS